MGLDALRQLMCEPQPAEDVKRFAQARKPLFTGVKDKNQKMHNGTERRQCSSIQPLYVTRLGANPLQFVFNLTFG